MFARIADHCSAALVACGMALSVAAPVHAEPLRPATSDPGVVTVRSAYPMAETVMRLKGDIAAKGITFFLEVDQAKLAHEAGIPLHPSTLLIFGNPALGTQFMTANPQSGIDWPVRLLVMQDRNGDVWAVYSDFGYIARRHGIDDANPAFSMASKVIASITGSVAGR